MQLDDGLLHIEWDVNLYASDTHMMYINDGYTYLDH